MEEIPGFLITFISVVTRLGKIFLSVIVVLAVITLINLKLKKMSNLVINPKSGQPVMRVFEFDTMNSGKVSIPEPFIQLIREILYIDLDKKTVSRNADGNILPEFINQKYCEILTAAGCWITVRCRYNDLHNLLYRK